MRIPSFILALACIVPATWLFSCKKEKAVSAHPELTGYWTHSTGTGNQNHLEIRSDSKGSVEYDNHKGNYVHSNDHLWLLKKNVLHHGRGSLSNKSDGFTRFHIDQYPQTATADFVAFLDTIRSGDDYMILDGDVYFQRN
jgi:hypothetical protein